MAVYGDHPQATHAASPPITARTIPVVVLERRSAPEM
jgi:hypothetical protein